MVTAPGTPEVGWQLGLDALRRVVAVRGSADPEPRVVAGGVAVGAWVADVRDRFIAGHLSPAQIHALQALPGWRWDAQALRPFSRGLTMLGRYGATHDLAAIPTQATAGRFRVGVWVALQRAVYENGALTLEQIEALEQIPGWRWKALGRWDRGFSALALFVQRYGHADVATDVIFDDYPLGRWAARQRSDQRENSLPAAHIQLLQSLPGWRWAGGEPAWQQGLTALRQWTFEHGTADPPQRTVDGDDLRLGQWVAEKRRQYAAGSLPLEQQHTLESLPGWVWSVHEARWQRGFAALTGYLQEFGHAGPPLAETFGDYPVGGWVSEQRRRHRRGRMPEQKAAALQALPGWRWQSRKLPKVDDSSVQ